MQCLRADKNAKVLVTDRPSNVNVDTARSSLRSAAARAGACWKPLALTDIAWKILAFVVLTPLVTLCFRGVLALSGGTVVADQDILLLFVHPAALVCGIVLAGMLLAIVALEQAALMAVLYVNEAGQRIPPIVALRFALAHAWPVLRLTAKMVGATLLVAAPFVGVLGLTYVGLLADHDINFYLKARPPAFWAAAAVGGTAVFAMAATLLTLFTGWVFALPILLFEHVPNLTVLPASRRRASGHRLALLGWIAAWAATVAAVSVVVTSATVWVARAVVPRAAGSVPLLAVAIGITLVVWVLVHVLVNLLGTTSAAVFLFTLYCRRGAAPPVSAARVTRFERDAARQVLPLTPKRLARWAIAGVLAAIVIGIAAVQTARLDDRVQIAAHRGASKAAPENSLSAVRQAIAEGADWVEIDVQETADGQVVVVHDSDFMKMAGVGTKVWDVTMAELAANRHREPVLTGVRERARPDARRRARCLQGQDSGARRAQVLRPRQAVGGEGRPADRGAADDRADRNHVARTRHGPEDEGAAACVEGRPVDVGVGGKSRGERRRFPRRERRLCQPTLRARRAPRGHQRLRVDRR